MSSAAERHRACEDLRQQKRVLALCFLALLCLGTGRMDRYQLWMLNEQGGLVGTQDLSKAQEMRLDLDESEEKLGPEKWGALGNVSVVDVFGSSHKAMMGSGEVRSLIEGLGQLPNLSVLKLRNILCEKGEWEGKVPLGKLTQLEMLYLNGSFIDEFFGHTEKMDLLEEIRMWSNNLESLDCLKEVSLKKLREVELKNNRMLRLSKDTFALCTALKTLMILETQDLKIDTSFFESGLEKVEHLDLNMAQFPFWQGWGKGLQSLSYMYLYRGSSTVLVEFWSPWQGVDDAKADRLEITLHCDNQLGRELEDVRVPNARNWRHVEIRVQNKEKPVKQDLCREFIASVQRDCWNLKSLAVETNGEWKQVIAEPASAKETLLSPKRSPVEDKKDESASPRQSRIPSQG